MPLSWMSCSDSKKHYEKIGLNRLGPSRLPIVSCSFVIKSKLVVYYCFGMFVREYNLTMANRATDHALAVHLLINGTIPPMVNAIVCLPVCFCLISCKVTFLNLNSDTIGCFLLSWGRFPINRTTSPILSWSHIRINDSLMCNECKTAKFNTRIKINQNYCQNRMYSGSWRKTMRFYSISKHGKSGLWIFVISRRFG